MTTKQIEKMEPPHKPLKIGTSVKCQIGYGVVVAPYEPHLQQNWGFDRYWVNFGNFTCLEYLGKLHKIKGA